MTHEELERLWAAPEHWRWNLVYSCARDPRALVPRRRRWMGWTLNFGHRWAWAALLLVFAVPIGPVLLLLLSGLATLPLVIVTLAASIVALIALSHWEATRRRE